MTPELTFLYVPGQEIGYGRMGVYIADELARRGVVVFNDDNNPNGHMTDSEKKLNNRFAPTDPTNLLCYASVPSHMTGFWGGQHRAFITMWEAMTLPESFRDTFHQIDTMIVPSQQNVELFSRYHDNVHYMPLGVDPTLWHYIPPKPPTTYFNFLIGGRGTRKGVDLAFRAFREVFRGVRNGPTPRLIMKSMKGHGDYYASNVEHVTGKLDPLAERDLYASAHCYLQPSRGEGFGLQPLQAIAVGRPTILTDAHGHASFSHLGLGIAAELEPSEYFIYGDAGDWWEPSYDELCEQMWDVYKNWGVHFDRAKKSAEVVAERWTWANTTDRFIEILGDQMVRPYQGDGTWQNCDRKLYPVITSKDWSCDIAGRNLQFAAGQEYYETADVKRILFDAGLLDPACCGEDNHGLTEVQVAQLDDYRNAHSHCLGCGRSCDCPTAADRIERELAEAGW